MIPGLSSRIIVDCFVLGRFGRRVSSGSSAGRCLLKGSWDLVSRVISRL